MSAIPTRLIRITSPERSGEDEILAREFEDDPEGLMTVRNYLALADSVLDNSETDTPCGKLMKLAGKRAHRVRDVAA